MIGRTISRYRIVEELGEGGMGRIYKAEDLRLHRFVALKFLPRELTSSPEANERLLREAQAAGSLDHPNICTIYEAGETPDGTSFIAMAYCEGESLKARIAGGPLPADEAVRCAAQVAAGLAKAHEKGIVHRDIKPANVIVARDGTAKIVDFGLAKLRGQAKLTRERSTLGTAHYMSPEQVRGEEVDHRTDLWSLGCTLYEMLTARTPFDADYDQALMYRILNEPPRPLAAGGAPVPEELERIVRKCLEKDPADRYRSAGELLADLEGVRHPSTGAAGTAKAAAPPAGTPAPSRMRTYVAAAAFVAVAIALVLTFGPFSSEEPSESRKSIAVIPFLNLAGGADEEYLSDGITDDILTQLYKIGDLRVISRTTMQQYKATKKSVREIGTELNAGAVLEGSVRRSGDRLRIVAQLIDARTDDHLWAETYDREMTDVLGVQAEIAERIAAALHANLTASERSRLSARPRMNAEAYTLVLQGGYHLSRGSRQDVEEAIGKLRQALAIEPENARAWARLATCYARQADFGIVSTAEGYAKAREAAENAIALDDQLAQGHTIMGWIKRSYDWDWAGAEAECRKALELAPGDVTVIRNMANMEKSLGRFDEAIRLISKAAELDPGRVPIFTSLGLFSMYAGRLEGAEAAYRRAIALNPKHPAAHAFLGLVCLLRGRPDTAIAEVRLETDEGWRLYGMSQVYFGAGRSAEADSALGALIEGYGSESAYQVAQAYAYRAEADSAFAWLEKAYAARDGGLSELKGDPFMRKIESDARYTEFLKKMGLPAGATR